MNGFKEKANENEWFNIHEKEIIKEAIEKTVLEAFSA